MGGNSQKPGQILCTGLYINCIDLTIKKVGIVHQIVRSIQFLYNCMYN